MRGPISRTTTALLIGLFGVSPAFAQSTPGSEIEALRQELRKLQEQLQKLEQSQATTVQPVATPAVPTGPPPVTMVQRPGEREIRLEREHPLETLGLARPEVGGLRLSGFFVGSANYNSHLQMVPEFAGNTPVTSEPRRTDFRFDQFTLGAFKTFAPWLSAGASLEVERAVDRHSHLIGCGNTCEQFGSEAGSTEVSLHRFNITGIAPIGNGLALSFGRFDTPYGYERHDAPLNLTASLSELNRFGRPMSMTGFQAAYPFTPWLDAAAWIANRWENETTEDPFEDNNGDKSFGGRIGVTPLTGAQLLNFGLGGWWGPERSNNRRDARWVVDADVTWSPMTRLFLTGELVYGGEERVSFRRRGIPFAQPGADKRDVNWLGLYALAHYDFTNWLGLSFRYGLFDDQDGWRTGVDQVLQSWTFTPIVHLSRLIPDLRPLGVTYARTQHSIDWADLRLEYRLNHSNQPVFSSSRPGFAITDADQDSHQVTMQFIVNF